MALSIDISRALRTRSELHGLVEAIRDAPAGEPETDWVEWKTGFDLSNNVAHRFETARHILGFGNRHPTAATPYCQGTAYLVLGVEPSNLVGVAVWDPADLDNWLSAYIAAGRPRWRSDAVEFDGLNVVVFTVEAPQWGDHICTLQKGFNRHPDGRIFVRRNGKTIEPGPSEVTQLEERTARGANDIEVSVGAEFPNGALTALALPEHAPADWVQAQKRDLLAPIAPPTPRRNDPVGRASFDLARPSLNLDSRSKDDYRAEVETYLAGADKVFLAQLLAAAVRGDLAMVRFAIVNPTPRNFPEAELEVRFPEGVRIFLDEDDPAEQLNAPSRPAKYGSMAAVGARVIPRFSIHREQNSVSYDNGCAVVRFIPVDVRPGRRHTVTAIHLGIPAGLAGTDIAAEWRVTSTGATNASDGALRFAVTGFPAVPRLGSAEED